MRLYASNANQSRTAARYARLNRPMSTVLSSSTLDGTLGFPVETEPRSAGSGRKAVRLWLKARLGPTG